jgi:YHS domain-containing protein
MGQLRRFRLKPMNEDVPEHSVTPLADQQQENHYRSLGILRKIVRQARLVCSAMVRSFLFAAAVIVVGSLHPSSAQTTVVGEPLALQGYDPVAYFTDGKALRGTEKYQMSWDGVRYQFVTPEHRQAFRREPDKFAPQFAGSCAMGMAAGKRVEANPEAWLIMDGKLYVFFSTDARQKFLQDPAGYLAKAKRTEIVPPTTP